ncbi:phosphopantetheine-binding protein [Kitasatospora xanthocidica]|uniref:phosphopantetheine-binding protein n=1 Tax=Kitasatospora xanthocidica TaxID=83382 RepID=UPI0036EF4005
MALVEQALAGHPGVLDAAVTSAGGGVGVVGVGVVAVLGEMCTALEVREDLRTVMTAAGHEAEPAVLPVARIPERPIGPVEEIAGPSGVSRYEPPGSELEASLASRLAGLLGLPRVGVLDDFVELGGDSLTAVTFLHALQEAYDAPLSVVELFSAGTVREIAELLAGRLAASSQVV